MNKLELLNDYILETLGMELMDEDITSVKDTIEGSLKTLSSDEFKNDDNTSYFETIEELRRFIDFDCLYAINSQYGGCFGQGYIIIDKEIKYIDFIRTI